MAIAVAVTTESGDDYVFAIEEKMSNEEVVSFLKRNVYGFAYISKVLVDDTNRTGEESLKLMQEIQAEAHRLLREQEPDY